MVAGMQFGQHRFRCQSFYCLDCHENNLPPGPDKTWAKNATDNTRTTPYGKVTDEDLGQVDGPPRMCGLHHEIPACARMTWVAGDAGPDGRATVESIVIDARR